MILEASVRENRCFYLGVVAQKVRAIARGGILRK